MHAGESLLHQPRVNQSRCWPCRGSPDVRWPQSVTLFLVLRICLVECQHGLSGCTPLPHVLPQLHHVLGWWPCPILKYVSGEGSHRVFPLLLQHQPCFESHRLLLAPQPGLGRFFDAASLTGVRLLPREPNVDQDGDDHRCQTDADQRDRIPGFHRRQRSRSAPLVLSTTSEWSPGLGYHKQWRLGISWRRTICWRHNAANA